MSTGGSTPSPNPIPQVLPLTHQGLIYRPLETTDRDSYVRLLDLSRDLFAPWVLAPAAGETPATQFESDLKRSLAAHAAGQELRLGAFLEETRDLVGLFNLNNIVRGVFQSAYASWRVGAPWVNRGIGERSVKVLLRLAFAPEPDGLGLHRVQANIIPANAPSLRIAEKCGFRFEGRADRYLKIAGRWQDHLMFAITSEEWTGSPAG